MTVESELNGFILTTVRGDSPGVAIWNGAGQLNWSLPQPEGRRKPQTHYLDGQIFRNFMDLQLHQEIGQIEVLDIEAKVEGTIELPLHHHAFTPIGPSQVAALAIDVKETDEFGPVVGDKVMIADVGGSQFPLFSVWDHFQVAETPRFNQPFYNQGKDWTHHQVSPPKQTVVSPQDTGLGAIVILTQMVLSNAFLATLGFRSARTQSIT